MADESILTAAITGPAVATTKGDGEFTPNPMYVEEIAEKKDTKEWQNALSVLDHTVKSFEGQQVTDEALVARLERIWVWMNT